jgi:hypothetical protein
VLAAAYLWRRLMQHTPAWTPQVVAYAVGCVASYWVFERLAAA